MPTKIIHECTQAEPIREIRREIVQLEKAVATLKPEVDSMYHVLEGNGQKGLKELVIRLDASVSELCKQVELSKDDRKQLREGINGLVNYNTHLESVFKEQEKEMARKEVKSTHLRWLIGLVITLILGVATLSVSVRKERIKVDTLLNTMQDEKYDTEQSH